MVERINNFLSQIPKDESGKLPDDFKVPKILRQETGPRVRNVMKQEEVGEGAQDRKKKKSIEVIRNTAEKENERLEEFLVALPLLPDNIARAGRDEIVRILGGEKEAEKELVRVYLENSEELPEAIKNKIRDLEETGREGWKDDFSLIHYETDVNRAVLEYGIKQGLTNILDLETKIAINLVKEEHRWSGEVEEVEDWEEQGEARMRQLNKRIVYDTYRDSQKPKLVSDEEREEFGRLRNKSNKIRERYSGAYESISAAKLFYEETKKRVLALQDLEKEIEQESQVDLEVVGTEVKERFDGARDKFDQVVVDYERLVSEKRKLEESVRQLMAGDGQVNLEEARRVQEVIRQLEQIVKKIDSINKERGNLKQQMLDCSLRRGSYSIESTIKRGQEAKGRELKTKLEELTNSYSRDDNHKSLNKKGVDLAEELKKFMLSDEAVYFLIAPLEVNRRESEFNALITEQVQEITGKDSDDSNGARTSLEELNHQLIELIRELEAQKRELESKIKHLNSEVEEINKESERIEGGLFIWNKKGKLEELDKRKQDLTTEIKEKNRQVKDINYQIKNGNILKTQIEQASR